MRLLASTQSTVRGHPKRVARLRDREHSKVEQQELDDALRISKASKSFEVHRHPRG